MHPAELVEQLGVAEGDQVRVRSARGELVLRVGAPTPRSPDEVAVMAFNAAPVDEPGASSLIDASSAATDVRLETIC